MTKPKKQPEGPKRVRMVGEREETVEVPLSTDDMDASTEKMLTLLEQRDSIDEKAKEIAKNYKSQGATLDLEISELRRAMRSRKRSVKLTIQEWLTESNEIIRVRADTDERIGDVRKARSEELQEKLFKDELGSDDGAESEATEEGDDEEEADANPFGDTSDDFGGSAH